MRIGIVKDGQASCKLCKWTETVADLQRGSEALVKHLRVEHYRSPLMMSYEDTKEGRVYSGPRWRNEMKLVKKEGGQTSIHF